MTTNTATTISPSATFTILSHAVVHSYVSSIHKAGCRDIKREKRLHGSVEYDVNGTLEDALDTAIDTEMLDLGYTQDDCQIHACCRK
jgi:hypothetical protein